MTLFSGLMITGVALVTYGWHLRKEKKKNLLGDKLTKNATILYKQSESQLVQAQTRFAELMNPETMLPASHRAPTTSLAQLASPWQDRTIDLQAKKAKKKAMTKERDIAIEEWRLYGRYLYYYWRPYWRWGVLAVTFSTSFGLYRVIYAASLKLILDGIAVASMSAVLPILLKLMIGLPLAFVFTLLGGQLNARLSSRIANYVRYDMFDYAQSLPLDYYKQAQQGDLLSRFSSDMTNVQSGMGLSFLNASTRVITILANLIAIFWLEWHLALYVLVMMPFTAYLLRRYSPNVGKANRTLRQREGIALSAVQEGIRAQPIIKSFGIRQFIQDAYWHELKKLEHTDGDTKFKMGFFRNYSMMMVHLLDISAVSLGVLLVLAGTIPVSTLVAFQVLIMSLRREFNFSMASLTQMIEGVATVGRVDELFQVPVELHDSEDAIDLPTFQQAIEFDHVSFSYTGKSYQLENITLTIEAGQFVAFVGPSGAGKSTVFNLLMRFYDVAHGHLTVDGVDVRDVTQSSLRAQMGVVMQETFLFNTTIMNNIRIVRPESTEEEVIEAAKAAELHDFIMSLPEGYQSSVGENGGKLSGGQKQRIAIARAILCNPHILLLDEATSSLDADTAAAVNATIRDLARERTVIAITHHLMGVVNADMIYVLDEGHLVEQGNHAELLAQGGLYAQLWQTQTDVIASDMSNVQERVS
ncbi:MAG: ABC transporter ATP-binding protein [Chloroflexota bacterium]